MILQDYNVCYYCGSFSAALIQVTVSGVVTKRCLVMVGGNTNWLLLVWLMVTEGGFLLLGIPLNGWEGGVTSHDIFLEFNQEDYQCWGSNMRSLTVEVYTRMGLQEAGVNRSLF